MPLSESMKKSIDSMDYESMLYQWRFAPVGHPMFQGEAGDYFSKAMAKKREEAGTAEHVRASKSIG